MEKKRVPIQNNIKERKRDKFMCDKLDYELDRISSWKSFQKPRRSYRARSNRRYSKPQTDYWTTDSGSDSSTPEDANNCGQLKRGMGGDDTTAWFTLLSEGHAVGLVGRKTPVTRGGAKRKD